MKKSALLRTPILLFILLLLGFPVFSQDYFTVNGKVTDEGDRPLEGVTIQVKGTKTFATSKKNRTFILFITKKRVIFLSERRCTGGLSKPGLLIFFK